MPPPQSRDFPVRHWIKTGDGKHLLGKGKQRVKCLFQDKAARNTLASLENTSSHIGLTKAGAAGPDLCCRPESQSQCARWGPPQATGHRASA